MRVNLDASVRTCDGEDAGKVQRAVIDPHRNEVMDFVVSTGRFLGKDVLVPRLEIESASEDGEAIRLRLSKDELDALPAYVPANFVPPPPGAAFPSVFGFPESAYLWPAAMTGYTGAPGALGLGSVIAGRGAVAGGADAATAGSDLASQPLAGATAGGQNVAEASLFKGAMVVDSEGNDVGVVDEVRFARQGGDLQGFVLRLGSAWRTFFGGGEMVEVPVDRVDRVADGIVHLSVPHGALAPTPH